MHYDAMTPLNAINYYFKMKPESMGDLNIYLGGKLIKCTMANGVVCWSLPASKYAQEAVLNVKNQCNVDYNGQKWPKRSATPFVKD